MWCRCKYHPLWQRRARILTLNPDQNMPSLSFLAPSPPTLCLPRSPGGFVTSLSYVDWDTGPKLCSWSIKICWPNKSHSFGFYIYLWRYGQGKREHGRRCLIIALGCNTCERRRAAWSRMHTQDLRAAIPSINNTGPVLGEREIKK